MDETPQVRLSIASLELASGLTFEQYVMRLPPPATNARHSLLMREQT